MTYEQITDLLDKGFTPEQITMLSTSSVKPTQAEDIPTDSEEESANPLAESSSESNSVEETTEQEEDKNTEVLAAIADLKKAVQANNIRTMSIDSVNPDAELEKAMSELIRPSYEKGDN